MKNRVLLCLFVALAPIAAADLSAADKGVPPAVRREIARTLTRIADREIACAWVRVSRIEASRARVRIHASVGLSYYPFREENLRAMYDSVRRCLPAEYRKARIELFTEGRAVEELIPLAERSAAARRRVVRFVNRSARPLVERLDAPVRPDAGLQDRHIALWQSHGRYFDQTQNRWRWQRTPFWRTCEDLYTQSYVLQYLVPMLENAGANVLLPRERDVQKHERIVDNDHNGPGARYEERSGDEPWTTGGAGFADRKPLYGAGENPFESGTVRRVRTVAQGGAPSEAVWTAEVPETGDYVVYVAYRTEPGSADDARYTVRHAGGESRFAVNQTMGGGTWIYLGRFRFTAESGALVRLSNRSARAGRIVTADAVKIGGGFGNIARMVCDSLRTAGAVYAEEPSGYPRFVEGARYWLQWAGFGEEVYTPKRHADDYKDDYMCRALWVNALMGGSERLPDSTGLRIPVDMALAFHSDSGVRAGDETVGTLGICCTSDGGGRFEGGADRILSRDLADLVMTQVVGDIRRTFEPRWTRRELWDRSYYEARVPCVPSAILELLSHRNFADMRYGSDPRFRFVVSRAVYKAILRHLAAQYDRPYVVQPLPVRAFAARFTDEGGVELTWRPAVDPLEPTAVPTGYVVYTRRGDGGFDNGRYTEEPRIVLPIETGELYSYKVTAANAGGESLPGETLSVCRMPDERGRLLVVNAFDRVSGPPAFRCDSLAGFLDRSDSGVPYLYDIAFCGAQRVFDRERLRAADSCALGACADDFETQIVGGNTFDYPFVHGRAAAAAGWSFVSASAEAAAQDFGALGEYDAVDVVLGKQRAVSVGRGTRGAEFRTFPQALQRILRRYAGAGGALLVSGCYAVSDLWEGVDAAEPDRAFAEEVLHCALGGRCPEPDGRVTLVPSEAGMAGGEYRFGTSLRADGYAVESTDVLRPAGDGAFVVCRYASDRRPAGVAWIGSGGGRSVVLGFPFEAVDDARARGRLMGEILRFLEPEGKEVAR